MDIYQMINNSESNSINQRYVNQRYVNQRYSIPRRIVNRSSTIYDSENQDSLEEQDNEEIQVNQHNQNTQNYRSRQVLNLQEQIEHMYQFINDSIMIDSDEEQDNDNLMNTSNRNDTPSDIPDDFDNDQPSDVSTPILSEPQNNEITNTGISDELSDLLSNNLEDEKFGDFLIEELSNSLANSRTSDNNYNIDNKTIMKNLFDSETANKTYLYVAQGWYTKDTKLSVDMNKHNLLATCVYCVKNFKYDDIRLFKNLPYKKCKINNIQTNNLFCVCQDCYTNCTTNNIIVPPNNIDDIKKIIFSKYENIIDYNHTLLYQKEIKSNKNKLDELKLEYEKIIKVRNYFENNNKLIKNSIDFEKTKHKYLTKIKKNNVNMLSELTNQSINNFQKLYTSQIKNVEKICDKMENICDIDKNKTVECKICMTNNVEMALTCGHTCCLSCIEQLRNTNYNSDFDLWINEDKHMSKCPICRADVDLNNILPIYL